MREREKERRTPRRAEALIAAFCATGGPPLHLPPPSLRISALQSLRAPFC